MIKLLKYSYLFYLLPKSIIYSDMADFSSYLKSQEDPIDAEQFKNLLKTTYFNELDEEDMNALMECYIPQKVFLTKVECAYIYQVMLSESKKVMPKESPQCRFLYNSLLRIDDKKIVQKKMGSIADMDVNSDFKQILGEQFYKKLINYGSNGLLFQKIQEVPHKRYSFFQWIQYSSEIAINQQGDNLYLQFLKQVWSFLFVQARQTLQKIKLTYPEDKQVSSVQIGLKLFSQIYLIITQNQELKEVFMERGQFNIKFQDEHSNKIQEKDFNSKINQVKQQLLFCSSYFSYIKKDYKNKYYYAVAHFLCNRQDNYVKDHDQILQIQEISITDRYFYARRFYRSEDFEQFKAQLMEEYTTIANLDYIILFGIRKQSQTILQNYIDQTNDLQKAALVSVYLKIFLEQGKGVLKDNKIAFYNRFIRAYQFLLIHMDSGISKHKFDQKCITIEVERKKKTMNKTFYFNCLQCKAGQCLLSITKRIGFDSKQHQVRMKGNNFFSKDPKNQIAYCLDCMTMLPKCAVCLYPITVYNGYAQELKKNNLSTGQTKQKNCGQNLANSLVWCPKCFHGGHFSHIMKWMQRAQKKCPVFSCKCRCCL